jgi:hypothetical protein
MRWPKVAVLSSAGSSGSEARISSSIEARYRTYVVISMLTIDSMGIACWLKEHKVIFCAGQMDIDVPEIHQVMSRVTQAAK